LSLTIAILAGGTGSVKLVRGLAALDKDIIVISNVGDNLWMYGLYLCPDIDTIIYGLAEMLDQKRGWGIKDDSFHCLAQLKKNGAPAWFGLGDKDLAMHLLRTMMIHNGKSLSEVTNYFRNRYSIKCKIIPATDNELTTRIVTSTKGIMHLQEFWVKHRGKPDVSGVRYDGAARAKANPSAIDAIRQCQAIIIAPANPISSIGPIVALSDLRKELEQTRQKVIAVSPLIGAKAVSGPAAKYMRASGLEISAAGVANFYRNFVSKFIISAQDHGMKSQVERLNMQVYETNITMKARRDELRLGRFLMKMIGK
jgi:LPPG:FO 2-phospho-L-lactate transferase